MNYISRLWRKTTHVTTEIKTDMMMATINPIRLDSIPLTRFIPKKLDISVGTISRMDTEVSVRMTVFMLLLIILW